MLVPQCLAGYVALYFSEMVPRFMAGIVAPDFCFYTLRVLVPQFLAGFVGLEF